MEHTINHISTSTIQNSPLSLEQQRENFKKNRLIAMPLADTLIWALLGLSAPFVSEIAALKLASDGLKTQDIAQSLFLSEGTVRNYLSEAISKLDATNRVDAARIAKQKGWL